MSATIPEVVPIEYMNVRIDCSETNECVCRYCHEQIPENALGVAAIRPCKCNAYVHTKCLEQWRNTNALPNLNVNEKHGSNNDNNTNDINSCEVCQSPYATAKVVKFDRVACCKDVFAIPYFILSMLLMVFALPFAMFGYSLFNNGDALIGVTIVVSLFYVPFIVIVPSYTICGKVKPTSIKISPFEYFNSTPILRVATVTYYISLGIIIVQALGLVIANPILGRPIAFTPTGETFGISLGILVGASLIVLAIVGIVYQIRFYARTKWIKETTIIVDNPQR